MTLVANGRRHVQVVQGASGFSAQNQRRLHFGLGADPTVERIEILWPSGATTVIPSPELDRLHVITESQS